MASRDPPARTRRLLCPQATTLRYQLREMASLNDPECLLMTTESSIDTSATLAPAAQPYQPFPTQSLPDAMRPFVEQSAASLGCDPAAVALPALAAFASLIGNTRVLQLKSNWS